MKKNTKPPKLSCIMTFFNEKNLITESIASILQQTYQDFELIIVDDGSSDDTASYVDQFDDPRIVRIRQANDGLSSARNRGLAHAKGEYVCFLDADDSRPPWAFAVIAAAMARSAADIYLCRGQLAEIRGQLSPFYDEAYFAEIRHHWPQARRAAALSLDEKDELFALAHLIEPQSANKVVRTAMLRAACIQFPNSHFFEDMLFHTACLVSAESLDFVDDICFTYYRRYAKKQITSTSGDMRIDSLAVAKLTLEYFANAAQFHSPWRRAAVLASTMRITSWCEETIAHSYRHYFRELAKGTFDQLDSNYRNIPPNLPGFFAPVRKHLDYATHIFQ